MIYKLRKLPLLLFFFFVGRLNPQHHGVHKEKVKQEQSIQQNHAPQKSKINKQQKGYLHSMWGYNIFFIGLTIYYMVKNRDHLHFTPSLHDAYQNFIVTYWAISLVVYLIYNSRFSKPYKVPRDPQQYSPSYGLVILQVLINQFVNFVPIQEVLKDLPQRSTQSWQGILMGIVVTYFYYAALFYIAHRLMHTPVLYQHIHGIHHEFEVPIGFTAMYAHPIEGFLDVVPLLVGLWMTQTSLLEARIWMVVGILNTVIVHTNAGRHSLHHLFHKCNFSTDTMDILLGTEYSLRLLNTGKRKKVDLEREKWIKKKIEKLPQPIQLPISRLFQYVNFGWSLIVLLFASYKIYDTHGTSYDLNRDRKKAFILLGVSSFIWVLSTLSALFAHDITIEEDAVKLKSKLQPSIVVSYGAIQKLDKIVEYGNSENDEKAYIKSLILVINYKDAEGQKRIFLSSIDYALKDLLLLETVMQQKGIEVVIVKKTA